MSSWGNHMVDVEEEAKKVSVTWIMPDIKVTNDVRTLLEHNRLGDWGLFPKAWLSNVKGN